MGHGGIGAKALELSRILVKKLKICTLGFMVPVWRRLLQTLGVASFRRMERTPRNLPMHIHILYTYTCIHVCTSLSVSTYMHVQTCMYSIYLSIYLCPSVCPALCLSASLSLCLSGSLSFYVRIGFEYIMIVFLYSVIIINYIDCWSPYTIS